MDMDFLALDAMLNAGFSEEAAEDVLLQCNDDIPLEDVSDYDMF